MKDKDVTHLVEFNSMKHESLPLTKCVCGARFMAWDCILSVYDEYPHRCTECGRGLYFRVAIKVFEKEVI